MCAAMKCMGGRLIQVTCGRSLMPVDSPSCHDNKPCKPYDFMPEELLEKHPRLTPHSHGLTLDLPMQFCSLDSSGQGGLEVWPAVKPCWMI